MDYTCPQALEFRDKARKEEGRKSDLCSQKSGLNGRPLFYQSSVLSTILHCFSACNTYLRIHKSRKL